MSLNTAEEIIADIKAGKMVILMDDEDRENEGDLIIAAEHITPDAINFMATYGRGLICLTMTQERCEQLNLPLMVKSNGAQFSTNFTLSIEAARESLPGSQPLTERAPFRLPLPKAQYQKTLCNQGTFSLLWRSQVEY